MAFEGPGAEAEGKEGFLGQGWPSGGPVWKE